MGLNAKEKHYQVLVCNRVAIFKLPKKGDTRHSIVIINDTLSVLKDAL